MEGKGELGDWPEPRSRESTSAAWECMGVNSNQSFYVLDSSFSDRKVQLAKHTRIVWTAEAPSIIHAVDTEDWKAFPMKTPEASTYINFNVLDRNVAIQASQQTDWWAVNNKSEEPKYSHISPHTAINEDSP